MRTQCKGTKTSMAPFRAPYFDRRFYLAALLHWTTDSACSQNIGHRTPFSVSFWGKWSFTCQHSGGTDGPMRLNLILRYHPLRSPRQRRQHNALHRLVFGYNARFPTTVTLQGDLYCSRSVVVRVGHPLNHKLCPAPRPGMARVARGQ